MPAYMLIAAKITDRERFINDYAPAAAKVVAQFGGRYLYRGRGATLLEGDFGEGASTMISEWPDKATAEAFWNSPEYAEAKLLREGAADCQVLLVEMERLDRR